MKQRLLGLGKKHRQFLSYSVIGLSGVMLDFVVFLILYNIFHLNPLLANLLSTSCGITNNFFLNRHFTFKIKDLLLLRFLSFYATGIAGIIVSSMLLRIFHDFAGFNANIVKLLSICIVVILQYGLNKSVSFRERTRPGKGSSIRIIGRFLAGHWPELLAVAILLACYVLYVPRDVLGTDESDNFLSAKLLLAGQLPYKDFFSHHMPGAYFISTLFYVLANGDALQFRIIAMAFVAAWTLGNFLLLRRFGNRLAAIWYLIASGLAHGILLQYMWLAETYIALAFSTLVICLLTIPAQTLRQTKNIWLLALLLASIPLMAVSYIYAAALLYLLALYRLWPLGGRQQVVRTIGIILAPYTVFGLYLLATGSLHRFLFQNLTFNAKYYAPFFGDIGGNPVVAGWNIIKQSLNQIVHVLVHAPSHLQPLMLLLAFMALPVTLWIKRRRTESLLFACLLLFVDPRVGVFGGPAIELPYLASASQHAELYRTAGLLFSGLALAIVGTTAFSIAVWRGAIIRISRWKSPLSSPLLIAIFVIILGANIVTLATADHQYYTGTKQKFAQLVTAARQLPSTEIRAVNDVTTASDMAWVGPVDFLGERYLHAKRATSYTFFLPWHDACPDCRQEFYSQLGQQKPLVIVWHPGYQVSSKAAPTFDRNMQNFLAANYYQINSSNPTFKYIYFRNGSQQLLRERLEAKGYGRYN